MPDLGRIRFFSPPKKSAGTADSMAAQYDSLNPGEILVYHHGKGPAVRTPGDLFDVAWRLSAEQKRPLVQWPEEPSGGDKGKVRRWFYGLQKPGRAA